MAEEDMQPRLLFDNKKLFKANHAQELLLFKTVSMQQSHILSPHKWKWESTSLYRVSEIKWRAEIKTISTAKIIKTQP